MKRKKTILSIILIFLKYKVYIIIDKGPNKTPITINIKSAGITNKTLLINISEIMILLDII